jgi:hypothetical protein
MRPLLGKAVAIEDQNGFRRSQPAAGQLLQTLVLGLHRPITLADKLLQPTHGIYIRPFQRQDHRLDRFALQIGQLAAQVKGRPLPLLAPRQTLAHSRRKATNSSAIVSITLPGQWPAGCSATGRRLRQRVPRLTFSLAAHGDLLLLDAASQCNREISES